MSTGDPICVHGSYLCHCMTCHNWMVLGLDPMEEIQKTPLYLNTFSLTDGYIGYDPEQNKISSINAINNRNEMISKMIPEPLDDSYLDFFREEYQKTAVVQLRKEFLNLSLDQKRQVLKDICMFCLEESRGPCYCERDD